MKTTVKTVKVEITDNGRQRFLNYTIATPDGTLMTNRLRKLLSGNLGHCSVYDDHGISMDMRDIHFVGMVWRPPYQLLKEITQDRIRMQEELCELEGKHLGQTPQVVILNNASSGAVSKLIMRELDKRESLKASIIKLSPPEKPTAKKNSDSDAPVAKPYSW